MYPSSALLNAALDMRLRMKMAGPQSEKIIWDFVHVKDYERLRMVAEELAYFQIVNVSLPLPSLEERKSALESFLAISQSDQHQAIKALGACVLELGSDHLDKQQANIALNRFLRQLGIVTTLHYFQLIERCFKLDFFLPRDEESQLESWLERMASERRQENVIGSLSIDDTKQFLRAYYDQLSSKLPRFVLHRKAVEQWIWERIDAKLAIPFFEAVFLLWDEIDIRKIGSDMIECGGAVAIAKERQVSPVRILETDVEFCDFGGGVFIRNRVYPKRTVHMPAKLHNEETRQVAKGFRVLNLFTGMDKYLTRDSLKKKLKIKSDIEVRKCLTGARTILKRLGSNYTIPKGQKSKLVTLVLDVSDLVLER